MNRAQPKSQFFSVLERMITTLETENAALRARRPYPVAQLNARKSMALYELERLDGIPPDVPAYLIERLAQARKLLDENRTLLKLNISALGDVIELLHTHQIGEESDGTYSAQSLSRPVAR
jgi:hypothetical protein